MDPANRSTLQRNQKVYSSLYLYASNRIHNRDLARGQHSSEETSRRWRTEATLYPGRESNPRPTAPLCLIATLTGRPILNYDQIEDLLWCFSDRNWMSEQPTEFHHFEDGVCFSNHGGIFSLPHLLRIVSRS